VASPPRSEDSSTSAKSRPVGEPALRLVRSDDTTFPEQLYATLAPVVNKLLWTLLGPDPDHDDLAHEIFLRILKNAGTLRDPSRLEAWAARVTVNAVKNEFRRRKLLRMFSFGYDAEHDSRGYHPDFEGRELLLRTIVLSSVFRPASAYPLHYGSSGNRASKRSLSGVAALRAPSSVV
jgi:hypothetical protein